MLILTRRLGETIRIGDDIEVTVLSVKGASVRIGITAPASVAVHREEIYTRILAERGGVPTKPGAAVSETGPAPRPDVRGRAAGRRR